MAKVVKGVAFAAAIYYGGEFAIGKLLASGVISAVGAGGLSTVANGLIASSILNGTLAQLQSGKKGGAGAGGQNVNFTGTMERRRIIYGEQRICGLDAIPASR